MAYARRHWSTGPTSRRRDFIELAERLTGDVDALDDGAGRLRLPEVTCIGGCVWRPSEGFKFGTGGSLRFRRRRLGRGAALRSMGDIRTGCGSAAERAVEDGDAMRAWTWQYLALEHRVDLTRSTMAAYHDGGRTQDGQFYDSDFGGPLYADGDEGLVLPELSRASHREAKARAKAILRRTP